MIFTVSIDSGSKNPHPPKPKSRIRFTEVVDGGGGSALILAKRGIVSACGGCGDCCRVHFIHIVHGCAFITEVLVAILHFVIMSLPVALQIQRPLETDVCSFAYRPCLLHAGAHAGSHACIHACMHTHIRKYIHACRFTCMPDLHTERDGEARARERETKKEWRR